jgi:D-psicose/D-tagatose/L-ribulose 3-epimerase
MNKFGVCTWTFSQPLAKTAETLSTLGFDGVELLGDLGQYSAAEAKKILDDNGLEVLSLTPTDADISHPDKAIRETAVDYYYRLLDFAAHFGKPYVSVHGLVKRIAPIASQAEEDAHLLESVNEIVSRAQNIGMNVVFEVLNRYEAHQINNYQQALDLVRTVGASNFGVLLDAYHMNIEEAYPPKAIASTGEKLWVLHVADSNRLGIGYGNTDFKAQMAALRGIQYQNPIILECTMAGPNPFTPDKGGAWRENLAKHYGESLAWLKEELA